MPECWPPKRCWAQNTMRFALLPLVLLFGLRREAASAARPSFVPPGTNPAHHVDREAGTYTVQPGDTLPAIAARFGVDLATLQQLNGIPDPRHIYVGQRLRLPGTGAVGLTAYHVVLGDDLVSLAQRSGQSWTAVAHANRLTHPGALLVGQTLYLPDVAPAGVVAEATAMDTRLSLALRHDVAYWQALRLNPQPLYAGAAVVLPTDAIPSALPYPVASLSMTEQPVARGQTAIITVEMVVPASCTVTVLDVTEPCYAQSATRLFALLGFPPLLAPGVYDVELRFQTGDGAAASLVVPVHVAAGRYDFERIDLPPDRQSLLDPALSAQERATIAALRTLRTPDRLWEFPFGLPVEASVTSYYGSRRSYGYGFGSFHGGTDFQAERGMPFYAPASGVVVLAERLVVRGNAVVIDHGWGVVTGYWHQSRIDVEVGQTVVQGQQIGLIGNTGLSTGPHLHWELWVNGVSVSPLQWVRGFDIEAMTAALNDE